MSDYYSLASDTVQISKYEYKKLVHDQKVLNALYAGGVDNWEWYDASLETLETDNE